ncbi:MAG: Hpt domain-containing protein [Pseudomonadota bacterium]
MNFDQTLHVFVTECRELLEEMEATLLALEDSADRGEGVNAIFRAAHTIKGSAGMFGLDHIVAFTHVVESVLDRVRDGATVIDATLLGVLLGCTDHTSAMVTALEAGRTELGPEMAIQGQALHDALAAYLPAKLPAKLPASTPGAQAQAVLAPAEAGVERIERERGSDDHWHISLRFDPEVLRLGLDPISFLRYLCKLGRIVAIAAVDEAMPPARDADPQTCYLGFEIGFASSASKQEIEDVFQFVRDDCTLRIVAPHSRIGD